MSFYLGSRTKSRKSLSATIGVFGNLSDRSFRRSLFLMLLFMGSHMIWTASKIWKVWPGIWRKSASFKIFTSNVVVLPPNPIGPIPDALISSNISFSNWASCGSGFLSPIFPSNAFLPSFKHKSDVPPIPTPITVGGQGFCYSSWEIWKRRLMPRGGFLFRWFFANLCSSKTSRF